MIFKKKFLGQFAILVVFILFSRLSYSSQLDSAEKVLNYFYHSYIREDGAASSDLVTTYVLSDVIKSVNNSSLCNYDSDDSASGEDLEKMCAKKRDCKSSKGDYICNWDGVWVETDVNYFTKSQDIYPTWKKVINITPLKKSDASADFKVSLGKYPEPVMRLKVSLVPVERSWKISRVTKY